MEGVVPYSKSFPGAECLPVGSLLGCIPPSADSRYVLRCLFSPWP